MPVVGRFFSAGGVCDCAGGLTCRHNNQAVCELRETGGSGGAAARQKTITNDQSDLGRGQHGLDLLLGGLLGGT